ncbi:unnamed protein product, partial [Phaeothamnion confervicola]
MNLEEGAGAPSFDSGALVLCICAFRAPFPLISSSSSNLLHPGGRHKRRWDPLVRSCRHFRRSIVTFLVIKMEGCAIPQGIAQADRESFPACFSEIRAPTQQSFSSRHIVWHDGRWRNGQEGRKKGISCLGCHHLSRKQWKAHPTRQPCCGVSPTARGAAS